jgi:serine/threonine protein kinase
MALTPGTKLGPYEIQSLLGAGRMGEVYRARDARLERDVAIKVRRRTSANREARKKGELAILAEPASRQQEADVCKPKQDNSSEIIIQTGGQWTSVIKRAEFITWVYSRTGHILYQMGSSTQRGIASFSIGALPFDAAKLRRTGEPFQAISDGMAPTVSAAGTLLYRTRSQKENRLVRATIYVRDMWGE